MARSNVSRTQSLQLSLSRGRVDLKLRNEVREAAGARRSTPKDSKVGRWRAGWGLVLLTLLGLLGAVAPESLKAMERIAELAGRTLPAVLE